MNKELKPCQLCGRKPVVERWSSVGTTYMVKCNNPDCPVPVESYPAGHNLVEVMEQFGCDGILTDIIEIVKGGGVDGN